MFTLLTFLGPILGGVFFSWVAGKCRGKNARRATNYASWGSWLLLLWHVQWMFPLFWPLNMLLSLTPSVICFILAGNSMLKEMRAQQRSEYTERA